MPAPMSQAHEHAAAPAVDNDVSMAFAMPDIRGKEIQIATAFYLKQDARTDPGVPAMLADLVTNDSADILATAYASV